MSDEVTITISRSRLRELVYAELELDGLQAAGVDNWEGYENTDIIEDEQVEEEVKRIIGE